MGVNYYWHERPECESCGRPFEALHIGKSSYGWNFALHVIPDSGIRNLADWEERWSRPGSIIRNEDGELISPEQMRTIITECEDCIQHKLDGRHCVGHGAGTWDHIRGDFS